MGNLLNYYIIFIIWTFRERELPFNNLAIIVNEKWTLFFWFNLIQIKVSEINDS